MTDDGTTLLHTDPHAQKELDELQTVSTAQIHQLYLDVLKRHQAEMAAISPSSVLHDIKIPLFILHGKNDPVFPEGEVEWMRKELAGNQNAHILVTPWISHAFVGQPATPLERLRVVGFAAELLNAASRSAPIAR